MATYGNENAAAGRLGSTADRNRQYGSGFTGAARSFHDARNAMRQPLFGRAQQVLLNSPHAPAVRAMFPNQAGPAMGQQAPMIPQFPQGFMPSQWLGIGGGSPYGVNLPSYGYFGSPQQRPLMMGGL